VIKLNSTMLTWGCSGNGDRSLDSLFSLASLHNNSLSFSKLSLHLINRRDIH